MKFNYHNLISHKCEIYLPHSYEEFLNFLIKCYHEYSLFAKANKSIFLWYIWLSFIFYDIKLNHYLISYRKWLILIVYTKRIFRNLRSILLRFVFFLFFMKLVCMYINCLSMSVKKDKLILLHVVEKINMWGLITLCRYNDL